MNAWLVLVFLFGNLSNEENELFYLFEYLNSSYWTWCIIGTMLVHQRAIGEYHSIPQEDFGFTKGHIQEHLGRRDKDILNDLDKGFSAYGAFPSFFKLTLAISTSSGIGWRWLIASKRVSSASASDTSAVWNLISRNFRILASVTSTIMSKNHRLIWEIQERKFVTA